MSSTNRESDPALESAAGDRPHRPADDKEEIYFQGSPLLRGQLGQAMLWFLIGAALIGAAIANLILEFGWPMWVVIALIVAGLVVWILPVLMIRTIRYRVSNYRIDYERGILTKKIDTLELWHVDDISFQQSLIDRMVGVGSITIHSDDQTTPKLELHGIPRPRPVFESLKQRIIAVKRQRGVIKMDIG